MKGFVKDIESIAVKNEEFRRVLYTAKNCQLVVMALKCEEEIGAEVHHLDQFFRIEEGTGEAVLDGVRTAISAGFAVLVPAGTHHNIVNTGSVPLKLYTLYAPPNHRDGVVHHTRTAAEADSEHFDGKTTEEIDRARCTPLALWRCRHRSGYRQPKSLLSLILKWSAAIIWSMKSAWSYKAAIAFFRRSRTPTAVSFS